MKIENVGAVIWDLDGTIIESFSVVEKILQEITAEQGRPIPTHEEILLNYHGTLEDTIQGVLDITSGDELDAVVTNFLNKEQHYYEGDASVHLFVDAIDLAHKLTDRGAKQLLVTNRTHNDTGNVSPRAIVATTVLADYIKDIRCSDEVEYRKPDKRVAQDWVEDNSIDPTSLLVIGDQFVDAQLATNLGCRAILVLRGSKNIPHLDSIERNHVLLVDNLHEVELV
jgi:phosphoglycolate phosphatase-like HAD superfamily hydrolase